MRYSSLTTPGARCAPVAPVTREWLGSTEPVSVPSNNPRPEDRARTSHGFDDPGGAVAAARKDDGAVRSAAVRHPDPHVGGDPRRSRPDESAPIRRPAV